MLGPPLGGQAEREGVRKQGRRGGYCKSYPFHAFQVPLQQRVQGEDHIMAQALELKREREIYSDLVSRARVKQLLLQLSAGVHQHLLTTQYYLQSKGELNLGYLGTTESIFDS